MAATICCNHVLNRTSLHLSGYGGLPIRRAISAIAHSAGHQLDQSQTLHHGSPNRHLVQNRCSCTKVARKQAVALVYSGHCGGYWWRVPSEQGVVVDLQGPLLHVEIYRLVDSQSSEVCI